MPFNLSHVLTEENLITEFICAICQQLADPPAYTKCTHVFCTPCIQQWMRRNSEEGGGCRCPTCNANLPAAALGTLKGACPLGWRVLSKVRVACPLREQGCTWAGDFSEVGSHLTNSESHIRGSAGGHTGGEAAAGESGAQQLPPLKRSLSSAEGPGGKAAQPSPRMPSAASAGSTRATAEALKEQGNTLFEQRQYSDAVKLYSKAIALQPNISTYYTNRAAAWMHCGAYNEAVNDCEAAIRIDNTFVKAYVRQSKALVEQGKFSEAEAALTVGRERVGKAVYTTTGERVDIVSRHNDAEEAYYTIRLPDGREKQTEATLLQLPKGSKVLEEEHAKVAQLNVLGTAANAAYEAEDFGKSRQLYAQLLQHTGAKAVVLSAARAEVALGTVDQALRLTLQVIKSDSSNAEAYGIRGMALFLSADYDQALKHLKEGLRLDPDSRYTASGFRRVRKVERFATAAKQAVGQRRFEEATESWTGAIEAAELPAHAPLTAVLHSERANSLLRSQKYDDCLQDCAVAIYAQDDCKNAHLHKASALHALERHEEALECMENLIQMYEHDEVVKHWHEQAHFKVRRKNRPDYYALLGVPKVASEAEIKAAYKRKALVVHPDKHSDSDEATRKTAEEEFKKIGEALEILGDTMKRGLYDEGFDREAIEERISRAHKAARDSGGHHHHH